MIWLSPAWPLDLLTFSVLSDVHFGAIRTHADFLTCCLSVCLSHFKQYQPPVVSVWLVLLSPCVMSEILHWQVSCTSIFPFSRWPSQVNLHQTPFAVIIVRAGLSVSLCWLSMDITQNSTTPIKISPDKVWTWRNPMEVLILPPIPNRSTAAAFFAVVFSFKVHFR